VFNAYRDKKLSGVFVRFVRRFMLANRSDELPHRCGSLEHSDSSWLRVGLAAQPGLRGGVGSASVQNPSWPKLASGNQRRDSPAYLLKVRDLEAENQEVAQEQADAFSADHIKTMVSLKGRLYDV
jgi:hypothetical protein